MTHEARVKELMENKVPWYFLTKEQKECFRKVGKSYCLYHSWCTGEWELAGIDKWTQMDIYRIKKDYQPETKIIKCEIYKDRVTHALYQLMYEKPSDKQRYLWEAQSDPDFAGFEFENGRILATTAWDSLIMNEKVFRAKYVLFRRK